MSPTGHSVSGSAFVRLFMLLSLRMCVLPVVSFVSLCVC